MTTTVYRRQSMAQLYEKLRAQDDDDDLAWLAQYSPDDKPDEPYVPAVRSPPALSAISSASPVSPCSSGSSVSDRPFNCESTSHYFDSDSEFDVDSETSSLNLPFTEFDPPSGSPLISQPHDFNVIAVHTDSPLIPSVQELSPSRSGSAPRSVELESSPIPIFTSPSITSRRITRSTQRLYTRYSSPGAPHNPREDVYSESDGNGSEDEYVPSPSPCSRKRQRFDCSLPSTATPSRKRSTENVPRKRPCHSPLPRNVQATPGITPTPQVAKNSPWACPYCKWVQRNHRTPDLKRHIRTHTRLQRPAQWVCCGVPVRYAKSYALPANAKSYTWGGEVMIGGCCKEFSRRDALKRHLDNDHIKCIGDFAAFASVCEDEI